MSPKIVDTDIVAHFSNADKVIIQLAESGKMNKWDIQKKTKLSYPRVHETTKRLEKNGAVKIVGKKKVQNKLPSPIYGLTFKGVMIYLSLQELTKLEMIGTQGEEELKERFLRSYKKRFKELQKLQNQLRTYGKDFDYPIFDQIDWLLDNYNWMILDIVLRLAKNLITNPPSIETMRKQQRTEERNLVRSIEIIKKAPSLQKMTSYKDNGKKRVYEEINVLKDEEARLEQLRKQIEWTIVSENEYLRKSFAYDFFFYLSHLKKNKREGNEILAQMANALLQEKRKTLSPLESIVKKFMGEDN